MKIILQDALKQFTLDQDKIISPEETVKKFKAKIKALGLNILERTVRIDHGRLNIPVFFSLCGPEAFKITGTKKQMGKGASPAQAEASAVMELAERFSFFHFCKQPQNFITAKYPEVKDQVIPFEMIRASVHDDSKDSITREMFSDLKMRWTRGYNLTTEREVLIPFDWFFAINEFNGPAAGNCTEEAISQGICEIVERHVSSIISQEKRSVSGLSTTNASNPLVLEMLQKYAQAGIQLYLSDFTLEMGIPTVGAMAYDPLTFPHKSEIVWTAGTASDPEKALSRTLTEVAQLAGDFNSRSNYVASGLPKLQTLKQADYIINPQKHVEIETLPNISNPNIKKEVENLISVLAARDMDVLLIDVMHSKLAIPAFYTIIPGAHFRERAQGASVGMFAAKLMSTDNPPAVTIAKLEKYVARLPRAYYLQFYLGIAHLALEQPVKALTCFKKALELEPCQQELVSIYSYMGVCLKDMGKYQQALTELSKGAALDQERTDIYNLMGFCYFQLKEHHKAITSFKKVLALDPGSAIDYANIASNYRELGQKEEAIHYYQTALTLDPSIEFAVHNLKKLI